MTDTAAPKIEQAYTALREGILRGTYVPRQRLILRTLAADLGMSTVPVREALRRLEAEGWVTIEPNVGAQVRPLDKGEYVAVMDTLAWAEGHATALAAPHLTPQDLGQAREHNQEMRAGLEALDPIRASKQNQAFHGVLRSRCPNEYLNEIVRHAVDRIAAMLRTVFVFVPMRTWAAVGEHEHLLELIEASAGHDAIERYAREHKLRTLAAYLVRETGAQDESPPLSTQEMVDRALSGV